MPKFLPGNRPKGHRKKGVPNKITSEVRNLAKSLLGDRKYLTGLRKRLREGNAGAVEALLWQYAFGRPKELDDDEAPTIIPVKHVKQSQEETTEEAVPDSGKLVLMRAVQPPRWTEGNRPGDRPDRVPRTNGSE